MSFIPDSSVHRKTRLSDRPTTTRPFPEMSVAIDSDVPGSLPSGRIPLSILHRNAPGAEPGTV
jgi:hypothetical protein